MRALPPIIAFAIVLGAGAAAAAETGLPLPRFASMRVGEANVRTGPGEQYPIEWVFVRADMPVEIIAEFDIWRKIRDWEGVEGWVRVQQLSGRRALIVTGADPRLMLARPEDGAPVVARLEPGVVGRLVDCPGAGDPSAAWCYVEAGGFRGWLARGSFWGAYAGEAIE
jgi:SH3-like domain-containing protein